MNSIKMTYGACTMMFLWLGWQIIGMSRFCPTLGHILCLKNPSGFSVSSQRKKYRGKERKTRQTKCFSAYFRRKLWENYSLKWFQISEHNPLCHRFWLNLHISIHENWDWADIRSSDVSPCFEMVFVSNQAPHNSNTLRSFPKNSISKPAPPLGAKPPLHLDVTVHFAGTLMKSL